MIYWYNLTCIIFSLLVRKQQITHMLLGLFDCSIEHIQLLRKSQFHSQLLFV